MGIMIHIEDYRGYGFDASTEKTSMDLSLLRHFGRADGLGEPFEFVCSSVKVSRSSSVSCLCRLGGGKNV